MKTATKLMVLALLLPFLGISQEDEKEQEYHAAEVVYIKPKIGMEQKLVQSIKEHNEKYHTEAPYQAGLYSIATGEDAGWMLWVMGTFTYSQLDNAPGEGAHMDDWRKKVDPYVQEYGRVEHWKYAEELSHPDDDSEPLEVVWFVDIESFDYYRFRDFMSKIQKVYSKQDEEMEVWTNMYSGSHGRDAAIFWPIDNWAALDNEDWKMRDVYEEEYGENSWSNALEDWRDFVTSVDRMVFRRLL